MGVVFKWIKMLELAGHISLQCKNKQTNKQTNKQSKTKQCPSFLTYFLKQEPKENNDTETISGGTKRQTTKSWHKL